MAARSHRMRGLASLTYVLMCALRRIALAGTELASATRGSIGSAQVTLRVRRVSFALASA